MQSQLNEDWERLLAAERHLQFLLPDAILVGGTAVALHTGHRISIDGDHVLESLRERFDEVLAQLEAAAGWKTERIQRPVLILGSFEGVLTGIRQLRRTKSLEFEEILGLKVPTLAEMARIKSWLLATRYTVRDYLDTVVLFERLGKSGVAHALASLDDAYPQPQGNSVLSEVAERLAEATPTDRKNIEMQSYKGLRAPWNNWDYVITQGRLWAPHIASIAVGEIL